MLCVYSLSTEYNSDDEDVWNELTRNIRIIKVTLEAIDEISREKFFVQVFLLWQWLKIICRFDDGSESIDCPGSADEIFRRYSIT